MKFQFLTLSALFICLNTFGQKVSQTTNYQFFIDLTKVQNDKLEVSLITPKMLKEEVVYNMPKIVPGTYANYDFGRYVSDFKAFDASGKALSVEKLDKNSYKIKGAKSLNKVTYLVDDTWDSPEIAGEYVFEPAGTDIEENKLFAINTHGFIGYFDDMKRQTYEVTFTKPTGFYGATSLTAAKTNPKTDTFIVPNYNDLVDAPIMYCKPDTTILKVGGADILISVFSPNKKATSAEIAANVKTLLEAQKEYLGGALPIKKYAFVIVLSDNLKNGSYGALEHSYSSFYYLPEASSDELSQTVKDVCSHEFFHIVTPLSIHSVEIGEFDFNKPKMSKHLWMYEGMTEYAAGHMQMKYNLIDLPMYLNMLKSKISNMNDRYKDDVPFTVMSADVLEKYKDQYQNVYEKGALIGLCLDVKLRQLSGGKYGTQNLMRDLSKYYGKEKSFNDDELFDKITEVTKYPEIRQFFAKYVEGKEPLPIQETLKSVGIDYLKSRKKKEKTLGFSVYNLGISPETKGVFIIDEDGIDELGKKLGLKAGDEFVSLNGQKLDLTSFRTTRSEFMANAKEGDDVNYVVLRKEGDKKVEVKLTGKLFIPEVEEKNILSAAENPTEEQLTLQKAWLVPSAN
ncbi:putative metalloprotease with PDZ domain [Arcicella aurantiaca]|uniref:Putative metalloprotease with PDZ domain n=1 Tax=Arcicella aurantiaca TaxID=591202 RepID=A0A316EAP8_9BACT|nr:peptidase M61 [Arcicella aurantiaca]PWK26722.1 putative metalloprotease with PDZ domain [Arcicella aurantiaca]